MNRFIKTSFAVILSIAFVTSLIPFSASAQSTSQPVPFNTTDKLIVSDGKKENDVTNSLFYTLFDNDNTNWYNDQNKDFYKESYRKAIKDGDWVITHRKYKTGGVFRQFVTVYWSEEKVGKMFLGFSGDTFYLQSRSGKKFYKLTLGSSGDNFDVIRYMSSNRISQDASFYVSYSKTDDKLSTFLSTPEYELDDAIKDWDINLKNSTGSSKSIVSPEFEYKIEDKKITIKHLKDKDNIKMSAFSNYTKDGWRLKNDTYQVSFIVQRKHSGQVIGSEQIIDAGGKFSIDVPENDEYAIVASYKAQACYSYGVGSATPDYCINAYPDDTEEIDYQSKTMYVYVDGKNHQGSTLTSKCLSGFCQAEPEYEDCSKHDLVLSTWQGGPEVRLPSVFSIACVLKNSFKWFINEVILPLFVPSQDFFRDKFGELQNRLKTSFGFLWFPFDFIVTVYKSIINNPLSDSSCSLPPMTIFGSTATIKLCAWRYQIPQMWSLMQTVIQGGIVFAFIWASYRLIMRFFGIQVDDDDDDTDTHLTGREYVGKRGGGMPL